MKSWILALRPKTMTAAIVPVIVGTALVHSHGLPIVWWLSICAGFSACFIQIGTNLVNDALDFHKGADTETRTGPQRVTQSGLLTSKQVMTGAVICFLAATALGIPLVIHGGWPIVAIGVVSIALAYGYTGGPYPLAYKGLGELFVILFFGLVAVMGTFYLHAGFVDQASFVAGLQVGFLATVLIAINNLRDAPQDALVAKKTLAVRFGLTFGRIEIAFFVVAPFALGFYWMTNGHPSATYLPFLGFIFARRVVSGVTTNAPSILYNKFLALAAALQMVFGLGLAVGLWLK
jgi:1,4-dihydroxy-2-naphthoate octaprenyltransferase